MRKGLFPSCRGQVRSFTDLILMVALVILFAVVVGFLFASVSSSKAKSTEKVLSFRQESEAVSSLRLRLVEGEDFSGKDISAMLNESKIVGGRVVTSCLDYITQGDCVRDPGGVARADIGDQCGWQDSKERCETLHVVR